MPIIRTARGVVGDKSAAPTLTIAGVQALKYASLIVGVTFDARADNPAVSWGPNVMSLGYSQQGARSRTNTYLLYYDGDADTNDIVASWGRSGPATKVMLASHVTGTRRRAFAKGNAGTGGDPTSGALVPTSFAEAFLAGLIASEGPVGDTPGTPSLGYTSGQRVGTTGGAASTNITLHEIYKITTVAENTRALTTGMTSRDWHVIVTGMKPIYSATVDVRVTLADSEATDQADAKAVLEADLRTRFPVNYAVEIIR
jgi:hypothetical protein